MYQVFHQVWSTNIFQRKDLSIKVQVNMVWLGMTPYLGGSIVWRSIFLLEMIFLLSFVFVVKCVVISYTFLFMITMSFFCHFEIIVVSSIFKFLKTQNIYRTTNIIKTLKFFFIPRLFLVYNIGFFPLIYI